jgi:nitrogen regulatory protein PII
MKRIEIIISRALDEEFIELLETHDINQFTAINPVTGKGYSLPKMGDDVWPQTNKLYIFYVEEKQKELLSIIVNKLREEFPDEGISAFIVDAKEMQ